jgi:hypothetical protein
MSSRPIAAAILAFHAACEALGRPLSIAAAGSEYELSGPLGIQRFRVEEAKVFPDPGPPALTELMLTLHTAATLDYDSKQ